MDYIKFSEHMLRKVRERQQELSQALASGNAQDYSHYVRVVGEISCLNFAEPEIVNLHSKMEEIND